MIEEVKPSPRTKKRPTQQIYIPKPRQQALEQQAEEGRNPEHVQQSQKVRCHSSHNCYFLFLYYTTNCIDMKRFLHLTALFLCFSSTRKNLLPNKRLISETKYQNLIELEAHPVTTRGRVKSQLPEIKTRITDGITKEEEEDRVKR